MARCHNQEFNLFDVFNHLWVFTDPVLRKYGENVKPNNSKLNSNNEISPDNEIFNSLIVTDDMSPADVVQKVIEIVQ